MEHKSIYFDSLKQPNYSSKEFLESESKIETIENLDVFKQNPRLLIRLRLIFENENLYEAHQLYKTIHFR